MPAQLTYPGVYIEEIPSGVRTIAGVATSVTAFIGRTQRGPVDEPTAIHSFADFERTFGGLWYESTVSYSVRDFYLNGGSEAIIVRLFRPLFNEDERLSAESSARTKASVVAQQIAGLAKETAGGSPTPTGEYVAKTIESFANNIIDNAQESKPAKTAAVFLAKVAKDAVSSPSSIVAAIHSKIQEIQSPYIPAFPEINDAETAARDAAKQQDATAESVAEEFSSECNLATEAAEENYNNAPDDEQEYFKAKWDAIKAASEAVVGAANDAVHTAGDIADAVSSTSVFSLAIDAAMNEAAPRAFAEISLSPLSGSVPLKLIAASPGSWGNHLRARVDRDCITEGRYGLDASDLFNLTIRDKKTGATEKFLNVTVKSQPDTSRRLDKVLESESSLVRASVSLPSSAPKPHGDPLKGNIWDDDLASTGVPEGMATDGRSLNEDSFINAGEKGGLKALEKADLFNLLCIPPPDRDGTDVPPGVYAAAVKYCYERRAVLLVDPPSYRKPLNDIKSGLDKLGVSGTYARNAALYFPRVLQADPLREGQIGSFVPCGAVAGNISRTDSQRGVWKAPAGVDASLNGAVGLEINMTDAENGDLNQLGINCLRSFPLYGNIVWGARTMRGADQMADEYKYLPVRRVALFIEESLYRGLKWVVFEPNDEPLWAQIRLNVGAFMHSLFRQGAFQGTTPREAYFVKCDKETTTQADINSGVVNVVVGFAPLKPAEFVVIKIQQMAGQIQT
jgi:uncharacterized protein